MADSIPRLEMDELDPRVAEALGPRVKRLGYLGEFFKCAGHQPEALLAFMAFTDACKGGLPDRVVELIALSVATRVGNAYERNQHERLSVRLGFGREWVTAVEALTPETSGLTPDEAAIQRYVLAGLTDGGLGSASAFGPVVEVLGLEGAVAVMMVMGRYLTHALVVNTLELAPPVPSIFEDDFGV